MSLNWDVSEVKDHKTLCFIETGEVDKDGDKLVQLRATTDRIIWGTMGVDLGNLKNEAECRTFFQRYCECCWAGGYTLDLTLDDVLAHMGLWTNVCKTSDAKWRRRLGRILKDRSEREMRRIDNERLKLEIA